MSRNVIKERVNKAADCAGVDPQVVDGLPWPAMVRIARGIERVNQPLAALRRAEFAASTRAARLKAARKTDEEAYEAAAHALRLRIVAELDGLRTSFPWEESHVTPTRSAAVEAFAAEAEGECAAALPEMLELARAICGRVGAAPLASLPWRLVHRSETAFAAYRKNERRFAEQLAELEDRVCSLRSAIRLCETDLGTKVRDLIDGEIELERRAFEARRVGSTSTDAAPTT